MSDPIYIEFRLRGYTRRYAQWVKTRLRKEAKKLKLRNYLKKEHVSHISLFGPAKTNHRKQTVNDIEKVSKAYTLVPFRFGGVSAFFNRDATYLFFEIQPSNLLTKYRHELADQLINSHKQISETCTPFDKSANYKFHSTVAKYSPKDTEKVKKLLTYALNNCSLEKYKQFNASIFERLLGALRDLVSGEKEKDPTILLHLLRVTVLGRRSRIICEYDLILKKRLSRRAAFSRYWNKKTYENFKRIKTKN